VAGVFQKEKVRCSQPIELSGLQCNHEEADSRIILHVSLSTSGSIVVFARDTDILVLLLAHHRSLRGKHIYMSAGKNIYRNIGEIIAALDPFILDSLLIFHSLTGCDSTSFFYNIGKVSAYRILKDHPKMLSNISELPHLTNDAEEVLEKFVCLMYGSLAESVDGIRVRMLLTASKPELMPQTSDALKFHFQRAFYQARVWKCATQSHPELPNPTAEGSGWTENDGEVKPITRLKDVITKACVEMLSCGTCTTGCISQRCRCIKAGLHCTALCHPKLPPQVSKNCLEKLC